MLFEYALFQKLISWILLLMHQVAKKNGRHLNASENLHTYWVGRIFVSYHLNDWKKNNYFIEELCQQSEPFKYEYIVAHISPFISSLSNWFTWPVELYCLIVVVAQLKARFYANFILHSIAIPI